MTAWYKAGTVSVTNGSPTVTGTATAWLAQVKAGDTFRGPDGVRYEISAVGGNTSITLATNYAGSTASGQSYAIVPTSLDWKTTSLLFAACADLLARFTNGWIQLGVNATPDGSNRLAVAAEASRFLPDPAGSGDHVQRIDKAAEANDARTQYEVAGSPRARHGLIDGDNYKIQVSEDGSTWLNVMVVDRTTGQVSFPNLGGGAIYTIRETLANEGELPVTGAPADAYLIDGDLWIWLPDEGVAGEWFNAGPLNTPGSTGAAGITGAAEWLFDTGTSDADPGSGKLRLNHATIASATKAFISESNIASAPQGPWLGSWGAVGTSTLRGELHIYKRSAPTTVFHRFKVTGSVVDDGSYRDVTLEYIGGDGALANNDNILVAFVPAGPAPAGIVANVISIDEISTPAAPSSGTRKFYTKSDGDLYGRGAAGVEYRVGGAYQPGFIFGLGLSNNGTDATNDIDIAAGACRAALSSSVVANLDLGSTLTKRLDAAWAVGSGNGGLDTGSIANGTYHVHLIRRSDTGVVDALFSLSATAPTMPANYDSFRRIGSFKRVSGSIWAFSQNGDTFTLTGTPIVLWDSGSPRASALLDTGVPTGVTLRPFMSAMAQGAATAASDVYMALGSAVVGSATAQVAGAASGVVNVFPMSKTAVPPVFITNTSGEIYMAVVVLGGGLQDAELRLLGWIDRRGQD